MSTGKSSQLPASAHICGIAIVNGFSSVEGKPLTVLLEAAFWNEQEPILGLFRYFNGSPGITFESKERYFICATIASFDRAAVQRSPDGIRNIAEDHEFDVMGDIQHIVPLPGVSAKCLPTVFITGRPSKIVLETATFEIDARQWVYFSRDQQKPILPIAGSYINPASKEGNRRPFPNANTPKFVQAFGFLTGFIKGDDDAKRFTVELQEVTFLGPAPPPDVPKILTPMPKGKRKANLDFDSTPTKKSKSG